MEFDERKLEVINRVVQEMGEDAIPDLLALLEKNEDDPELIEMIQESILRMGYNSGYYLRDYLEQAKKAFDKDPGRYKENAYRTTLLIVIDLTGQLGESKDIELIESFVALFDDERAHLIIYEAIAKLGGGVKYLDLLELYAFEDDFTEELIDQIVITLSYINDTRALFDLLKITQFEWLDGAQKVLTENALKNVLSLNKQYYELLEKDPYGKKVLKHILEGER